MRAVKVAQEGNGLSVVAEGVTAGQKVVTAGQYRLKPGVLVQATDASPAVTAENSAPAAPAKAP
jgi:hypothetical protein